ncbi:hypothetical protein LNV09_16510 [Paucibacter sp. B2R-40]|uniref:hypothetical protein n=1 Tax=Paucibacter sp. B2R-40 TaxID=2893554 RepID=UPI0021E5005A|nr:hypothetical protein [Paucibacter sp. B2R-40]MCV2355747.1 hypothetical protein [Paucibacter sp. B2R-40]
MSDSKGGGIPWTSVAVLVAFVGSTQLVPHAFEQLRPAEKERAQSSLSAEMEVDARLWEDPFAALRRYELERAERCERVVKTSGIAACRSSWEGARRPEVLRDRLDRDGDKDVSESLVVLALVPGNPFVGAEEGRRRTRYAVLAGLQAQGYVPDNAERIGLLEFDVQRLTNDCEAARAARRHQSLNSPEAPASGAAASTSASTSGSTSASTSAQLLSNNDPPVCRELRRAGAPKPSDKAKFTVPYEMLAKRNRHREADTTGPLRRFEQVAVLWVDESALPDSKLDGLARMVDAMFGPELVANRAPCVKPSRTVPRLAIIGPSSTDALRTALSDLRRASEVFAKDSKPVFEALGERGLACDCKAAAASVIANAPAQESEVDSSAGSAPQEARVFNKAEQVLSCPLLADPRPALQGYRLLAGAKIFNSASTASSNMLDELRKQDLDAFLNEKFNRMLGDKPPVKIDFQRTISTDNELIKRLVAELQLRLPANEQRRLVVVAERDSIYSQSLVNELQHRLKDFHNLSFEPVYFFRGIDGVTTRDAGRESNERAAASKATALEWPESRDQLDYLRRLASSLRNSEAPGSGGPIGAIGILANDVHDKLLVLQALHDTFSDKVFFTTDMDARFLHPRVQAFTRNLIVATSLPLEFYPPKPGLVDLQAGTPPLRDVYQTASYLAARRAACRSVECLDEEKLAASDALDNPSLYEIGRNGAVPLSGYALLNQPANSGSARLIVAGLVAALMLIGLLVWPSTPAIRQARMAYLRRPLAPDALPMNLPAVVLVALHAALCAYVFCSLIELVRPQQMSFAQTLILSALAAFAALLAVMPSLLAQQRNAVASTAEQEAGVDKLHVAVLALIACAWVWVAWPGAEYKVCLDCEPVTWLQGVSAWPSQLIHLLALMTILWTLDFAWSDTLRRMHQDSAWLQLPQAKAPGVSRIGVQGMLKGWFRQISISTWQRPCGESSDFLSLWTQYGERGDSRPRAARTIVWYLISVLVVTALFIGLSEGQVPEVPVRGSEHRQLVRATLYATLLLLPLLVVAVADATMLAFRFIGHLNCGRSAYPQATIAHFAQQLGELHAPLWQRLFPARLEERQDSVSALPQGGPQSGAFHCLLDDWLDVQVVARRTEYVSRLVIGPFLVLALLVVARSRLFDNWSLTPAIAVSISLYLIWLIVLASLLKIAAEKTRKRALASMNADLRWLAGGRSDMAVLVEPFKRLIASVEGNQTGAFAPMFEQPLLKALLVPLGGAGGAQLFDYLLLAR